MSEEKNNSCCEVEAIVSFDERGQLVIPKEVRKKYNLQPSDKFALISCTNAEGVCCFTLMKTDQLHGMVKQTLSPIFSEIIE